MIWIYVAAAIFGTAFVIPMLLGGLDLGADVELDGGFEVDGGLELSGDIDVDPGFDADLDGGLDADGVLGGVGDFVASLLSFRSIVMFAAFFGLAGMVFSWLDFTEPGPLLTAAGLGFFAAALNGQLFRLLKDSETSSQLSERALSGQQASVVIPLAAGRKGRIRADINGQPHYMVALPYRSGDEQHYDVGEPVVVIEIEDGTALVAPLPSLETGGK